MNQVRFVLGIIILIVLFMTLQLPDPARLASPENRYTEIPEANLQSMAMREANKGRYGTALLLLQYAVDNNMADASNAVRLAASYVEVLEEDSAPLGKLQRFGHSAMPVNKDWFGSLAGASLADFFIYGGVRDDAWQKLFSEQPDDYIAALNGAAPVAVVFPSAEPAINLLKVCRINRMLGPNLVKQQMEVLNFMKNTTNSMLAVTVAGESLMPVYQMAKKCKTWAEFAAITGSADSIDQVKMLTRMASVSPQSSLKLAQILIVARMGETDISAQCIDFILRAGQAGMDSLYTGVRKGRPGLEFILGHPESRVTASADQKAFAMFDGTPFMGWWKSFVTRHNTSGPLTKYGIIAILCMALCLMIMPPRVFHDIFKPAEGDVISNYKRVRRSYWTAVFIIGISICLLLMLRSVSLPTPPESPTWATGSAGSAARAAPQENRLISLVILLAVVGMVQGTCWWAARRKIIEIEQDNVSDARQKLRRLENLDIFFDLPLYCGLALTICAFILITTFGASISRFLAYSATFVGIVLAVILRVGYVYPLREGLIGKRE